MNHTRVMQLSDKVGGLFRLAVLMQKRVGELVGGAPKLVQTKETNPINIALLEALRTRMTRTMATTETVYDTSDAAEEEDED